MGFLDKLKHFAGGHGVKVEITSVERQAPSSVTFPLTDSVMKFQVRVTGDKEVTVLSHDFVVYAERTTKDNPRLIEVARDSHDEKTDILGANIKWPYTLAPGQVVEDGCCITNVDLTNALRKMDVHDPGSVLSDPNYRFFVKFIADVKGSPMDPEASVDFRVVT